MSGVCGTVLVVMLSAYKASSFSLVAITSLRYMSVKWPLHHRHMLTRTRVGVAIASIWVLAFTLGAALYARPNFGRRLEWLDILLLTSE